MRFKKFKWGKDTAKAGAAAADRGVLARLLQGTTDEWNHTHAGYAHARPILIVGPQQKYYGQPRKKNKHEDNIYVAS